MRTRGCEIASGAWILVLTILAPACAHAGQGDESPRSPAAERETFRVDAGLTLELVAAEPEIQSPVAMAFDEEGRLFVVEMLDYPNGPAPGDAPQGRIRRLEDRDGDGRFETSETFADGLLFANGLLPWRGGLIVTAAPHILYLKDSNGDGRADVREVWFEGFAVENPQLRVGHPILGLDGWVYVVNGLRGGKIKRPGALEDTAIDISGRDFRFDPRTFEAQAIAGMGQYGNTFDDWGRRFVCTNRNHMIPILFEEKAAARNPFLVIPPPLSDDQSAGGAAAIFPISRNFTTSSLHAGSFSAACSVTIYRGDALPGLYQGAAFTCDPTGNLVHMEVLQPDGASFHWQPPRVGVEFLASSDDWFRPVNLSHGPDGALYVVDMYRAVIEHPEWMPEELKQRPDLNDGRDMGRIWRITRADVQTQRRVRPIAGRTAEELVKLLNHKNGWHRVTAQRLLLERGGDDAREGLRAVCQGRLPDGTDASAQATVHAVWLLDALGAVEIRTLIPLLNHPHGAVREQAVALLETFAAANSETARVSLSLKRDDHYARVRYRVALALGACARPEYVPRDRAAHAEGPSLAEDLAAIGMRDADDPLIRLAVLSSAAGVESALLDRLASSDEFMEPTREGPRALWLELCRIIGSRGDERQLNDLLEIVEPLDEAPAPDLWRLRALAGLAEGMKRRGRSLRGYLDSRRPTNAPPPILLVWAEGFLRQVERMTEDTELLLADRVLAVQLLGQLPDAEAQHPLGLILRHKTEPELKQAAARTLCTELPDRDAATELLEAWPHASPGLRRELASLLAASETRSACLLAAVERGDVLPGDLDLTIVNRLVETGPVDLRARARTALASRLPADRTEVLRRYEASLSTQGDIDRGRTLFEKSCASCHRIGNLGIAVGPDISDTRTKTHEALLRDILDPNAAVDANYVVHTAALRDGRVLSGVIAAESAGSILLKNAEGASESLLRSQIEELRGTGLSLMPEGLENDISPEAMADLIAFLKYGRYRDLGVPIPGPAPLP